MERSNIKKYIIISIAIMFVISMFYQFGRNGSRDETASVANMTTGTAAAICRISGFASEVVIQPWNNETIAIARSLKDQGQIDYINTDGTKGFLILSQKSNISMVRNAYLEQDVSILAQASCLISGLVNFTFANGTKSQQAPGIIRMYLDPFSQVGEEINVDLVADISESGIEHMIADPVARTEQGKVDSIVQCIDYYLVVASIDWENRSINVTEISKELGINETSLQYNRNDAVLFSPPLNGTQLEEIRNLIDSQTISYVTQIASTGMTSNSTDKQEIIGLLSTYGIEPTFQQSQLNIYTDSKERLDNVLSYAASKGSVISTQKRCTLTMKNIALANGREVYLPYGVRTLQYYVPVDTIPENGTATVTLNLETVGRVAKSAEFVKME